MYKENFIPRAFNSKRTDRNHQRLTADDIRLINKNKFQYTTDEYAIKVIDGLLAELIYLRRNNRYALAALTRGEYYTVRKRVDEDWVSRKRK